MKLPVPQGKVPDVKKFTDEQLHLNRNDHLRIVTKRLVLYLGFKCNLRCQFCYYLKSIEDGTAKNFPFANLAKKITLARRLGKEEIDFTGGEATLHADFPKLIAHAKSLGFKTINVISNGWRLADRKAFESFVNAGLNEVLFSLHSHKAELHDSLTQRKGSHEKILQAIRNAHELGVRVRINSVVNPRNLLEVEDFMGFCTGLGPHSVNLIVFNPSEETIGYSNHDAMRFSDYESFGKEISRVLDKYHDRFPVVNVRFLPFCYAKGHEAHMRTYWQEIYERQEWDPLLHWAYRKNWWFALGASVAGMFLSLVFPAHTRVGRKSFYGRVSEWFQLMRTKYLFVHKKDCGSCQLRRICPGLHRDFNRANPTAKVFPYSPAEMPEIVNPVFFGSRYPQKFDSIALDQPGK